MLQVSYLNGVGSLKYVILCTRPEISQVFSLISGYIHDPSKGH